MVAWRVARFFKCRRYRCSLCVWCVEIQGQARRVQRCGWVLVSAFGRARGRRAETICMTTFFPSYLRFNSLVRVQFGNLLTNPPFSCPESAGVGVHCSYILRREFYSFLNLALTPPPRWTTVRDVALNHCCLWESCSTLAFWGITNTEQGCLVHFEPCSNGALHRR